MSSQALWIGLLKVGLGKSRKEIDWVRQDQRTRIVTFHGKWPELRGPRKRFSRLYVGKVQRNKKLMCNLKKIKVYEVSRSKKSKELWQSIFIRYFALPSTRWIQNWLRDLSPRCFLVDYCQPGDLALYFIKLMLWQNSDTMCHQMMLISFILCVHFIII